MASFSELVREYKNQHKSSSSSPLESYQTMSEIKQKVIFSLIILIIFVTCGAHSQPGAHPPKLPPRVEFAAFLDRLSEEILHEQASEDVPLHPPAYPQATGGQ